MLLYPRVWMNVVSEWAGTEYNGEIRLGDRVSISYDVQISAAESIVIEDDVTIAAGAVIVDHFHDYKYVNTPVFQAPLSKPLPVRIGKRSFLGVHCFVGPGVQIGEQAMIAANAVVTKDVPAYSFAAGNPARAYRFTPSEKDQLVTEDTKSNTSNTSSVYVPQPRPIAQEPGETTESHIRPVSSLFSNSVSMGVASVASRVLGYSYFILLARRLDARHVGAYALLITASLLVELVANLGLDKILIREIASSSVAKGKGLFQAALRIRLASGFICGAVAWTLLWFLFRDSFLAGRFANALFLVSILPIVFARNCEAFLTAHEHLIPIALSQLCERLIIFGAVLLLLFGVVGFKGLLCFTPLASLVRALAVGFSTARLWNFALPSMKPDVRRLLRQASELFSVEAIAQLYFRSDVFLLARMDGLVETGVYQIAYKVFDGCVSLFTGFLQAAFPRLVRDRSRRNLKAILTGGVALLIIPVAIIIATKKFILGAVKPEYVAGSISLTWLMLTVPLVYITSTLANAAVAAGQVRLLIGLAIVLLLTNTGMNLLLIPRWSINGAAFSTFACELLSAAVLGPIVLRKLVQAG